MANWDAGASYQKCEYIWRQKHLNQTLESFSKLTFNSELNNTDSGNDGSTWVHTYSDLQPWEIRRWFWNCLKPNVRLSANVSPFSHVIEEKFRSFSFRSTENQTILRKKRDQLTYPKWALIFCCSNYDWSFSSVECQLFRGFWQYSTNSVYDRYKLFIVIKMQTLKMEILHCWRSSHKIHKRGKENFIPCIEKSLLLTVFLRNPAVPKSWTLWNVVTCFIFKGESITCNQTDHSYSMWHWPAYFLQLLAVRRILTWEELFGKVLKIQPCFYWVRLSIYVTILVLKKNRTCIEKLFEKFIFSTNLKLVYITFFNKILIFL